MSDRRPALAVAPEVHDAEVAPASTPARRRQHLHGAQVGLVLVEDHNLVREGLRMVLSTEPSMLVVGEASDAAGAFRVLDETTPDVVILDLSLPDSDGLSLLRSMQTRYPSVRVLVLTMHRDAETVRQAFLAGASAYLVKGARTSDLYEAIWAVMRGERYVHSSVAGSIVDDSLRWMQSGGDLSPREREIIGLIASGRSASQIGIALGISPHTVRRHRANLASKLNVRGNAGLTRYALLHGLARETE